MIAAWIIGSYVSEQYLDILRLIKHNKHHQKVFNPEDAYSKLKCGVLLFLLSRTPEFLKHRKALQVDETGVFFVVAGGGVGG